MIRRILQFAFFLLFSVIEVRVHAAIVNFPKELDATMEPANCMMESSYCAVKTRPGRKFELPVGSSKVMLGGDSIVIRLGYESFTLVQGEAMVTAVGTATVNTEFGQVVVEDGVAWFLKEPERVVVRTLDGLVKIQPRGSSETIGVAPGYENWAGRVDASGHAVSGVPSALDLRDLIHRWARIFPGKKEAFKQEIIRIRAAWSVAVEDSAQFTREIAERTIASAEEEARKKAAARKAFEDESKKLRDLFRSRYESH